MNVHSALGSGVDLRTQRAEQLLQRFAEHTGLASRTPGEGQWSQAEDAHGSDPPSGPRYLWTDAFAVCNFLSLAQATGEEQWLDLARRAVSAVHLTLGRHRSDDWREGWLSGLSERGARAHPTWGGLRIGKPLPERNWDDVVDERLEWQRDGQYFHYLTRWMHALDQLARFTRQPRYNLWARELAAVAYAAFSVDPGHGGPRRLVWKMSIDLTRPLVASMGHHDALDGFITCVQLQSTAAALRSPRAKGEPTRTAAANWSDPAITSDGPTLQEERAGFAAMAGASATTDPLGLGALLYDAYRVAQLQAEGAKLEEELFTTLLSAALDGLARYAHQNALARPAATRLAFRELGLAIGLHALERLTRGEPPRFRPTREAARLLEALGPAVTLGSEIDAFWLEPEHREASSWAEHRDLNEVTLATSLCPQGYLELRPSG